VDRSHRTGDVSGIAPFQTVGPFFQVLVGEVRGRDVVVGDATEGTRITIQGTVYDGAGAVVPDALVEIWQADALGRYRHPTDPRGAAGDDGFRGFGRVATDEAGTFAFDTIKPGRVPGPDGRDQAPHVLAGLIGRGVLTRYITRIYFEDEPANADDPILAMVPAARRHTLIARRTGDGTYEFDIRIQGAEETVFFDV
jgi:protocatechuate 3,4-dioxygenase, alpha subunit